MLGLIIERAFRLAELQAENRRLQTIQQPDAMAGHYMKKNENAAMAGTLTVKDLKMISASCS